LEANGSLQPVVERQVFAHLDGEVEEVLVDHGDEVKANQPLIRMRNRDLEVEIAKVEGQLDETLQSITSLKTMISNSSASTKEQRVEYLSLSGQLYEAEKRLQSLQAQLELYKHNWEKLVVVSPIDGIVMTWDLKKNLRARPVMKGQVLVSVADPRGEYELEVLMPEKSMKYVDTAISNSSDQMLPVEFKMLTDPSKTFTGKLHKNDIHARAELDPTEGAVVKLRVAPDTMEGISRRPGAKVIADVTCGRASAAFVWFHEVIEWVQANVIF
jgi:multidrug efflux pump subunit AcrA (membrane-fusion protein)